MDVNKVFVVSITERGASMPILDAKFRDRLGEIAPLEEATITLQQNGIAAAKDGPDGLFYEATREYRIDLNWPTEEPEEPTE